MSRKPPPTPPPSSPSGDGHGKAGYRPHRQRGEAVAGHHADRPGDARSGPTQASLAWAAGGSHDYTHRGVAPLPAWYYVLHGLPVPDDAPRTQPPPGFAALMAKLRSASPDSASNHAEDGGQPGPGEAAPDDATAPEPTSPRHRRTRTARPATASTPEPAPPAGPEPPPAQEAQ